jgi:hypothetical protein
MSASNQNNMKYKYLIFGALTSLIFGCQNFLEVDPQSQIPSDAALSSGKNVESTVIASYSDLVSAEFLGQRVQLYSELASDNIGLGEISLSTTDFTGQVALRNTNILNKDVDNLWTNGYRAIARANAVIDAVDRNLIIDNTSEVDKNKWKGEALFIRGVAHFELVRLFAQPFSNNPATDAGIPIRIKSLTQDEKIARSPVSDVYTQVISDLQAAISLLDENNGNRANVWSAKAYLARVYFNKLDYTNAKATAEDIIENSGLTLSGDPLTSFRNNGNVLPGGGVFFQVVDGGNRFGAFRPTSNTYSISQGAGGALNVLQESGADDFRAEDMVVTSSSRFFSTKWHADVINPPVIRLAEIYLIHAESSANLDNMLAASSSYNTVRDFAVENYTGVAFDSKEEALPAIQKERRIELLFEGDRYHELRRLKSPSFGEVKNGATVIRPAVAFNDKSLLLKIPVSETSGNSAIEQN